MNNTLQVLHHSKKLAAPITPQLEPDFAGETPGDFVTYLLKSVDETILPRVLWFQTDDGVEFWLEVSARRILQVNEFESLVPPLDLQFVGVAFSGLKDDVANSFLEALATSVARSRTMTLRVLNASVTALPFESGCSALSLAERFGLVLHDETNPSCAQPLEKLIHSCTDILRGFATCSDTTKWKVQDPEQVLTAVTELEEQELLEYDTKIIYAPDQAQKIGCLVFNLDQSSGNATVYARFEQQRAFLALRGGSIEQFLSCWRGIFGEENGR